MKLSLGKGPLYMQVLEVLKNRIISGEYPIGSFIPPESKLKNEFKVSIITVRRAVEELALQGYVEKKSGVGTTVLDNNAISKLSKGKGFSEFLFDKGYELRKEFVRLTTVSTNDNPVLAKYFSTNCYCVERVYYLDDQPYIHFEHYISENIHIPNGNIHFEDSLYEIMYGQGIYFKRFQDELTVNVPTKHVANVLQVEAKPLLNRIRYSYDIEEQLIEYSVAFFNTDLHKYVINFVV